MIAELKKDGTLELELKREFPFPRPLIFSTWLSREHLLGWMGPSPDINLCHIEVDPRVGGGYRFGFKDKNTPDSIDYVYGTYQQIRNPEKLVFTWIWEVPPPEAEQVTLVTVTFRETVKGTEITVKHQKFMTEADCTRHREGWGGTLEKMNQHLRAM